MKFKHGGKGDNVAGNKNIINNISIPFGIFSGVITLISLLVSFPTLNIHIPNIDFYSLKIQSLVSPLKVLIFIISEVANGYFFAILLRIVFQKEEDSILETPIAYSLIILFITLSTFISILFLILTLFPETTTTWSKIGFAFFYILSLVITSVNLHLQLGKIKRFQYSGSIDTFNLLFLFLYIVFFVSAII